MNTHNIYRNRTYKLNVPLSCIAEKSDHRKISNNSYCSISIVVTLYPNPVKKQILDKVTNNNKNLYYLKDGIFPRKTYHLNKVLILRTC